MRVQHRVHQVSRLPTLSDRPYHVLDKVRTILDWPKPWKVKDVQSFLGFANFYCRFIYNYSDIVTPLTRLTRKGVPWTFTNSCRTAFQQLKEAFTSAPILVHWVPDAPMIVETDASDYAIAGILSICCTNKEIRPVTYYSWALLAPELNYDTHNKEFLAIHKLFWLWCHYLEGPAEPVDVVTDHKNLEYFSTTKLLTRQQAHWSEFLLQFNMVVCFRPRKLSVKPDALTRRWDIYSKERDKDYTQVNPHNFQPVFTQDQLAVSLWATYLEYPVLRASSLFDLENLHNDILSALPSDPLAALHMSTSEPPDSRWSVDSDGFLRLDGRIFMPESDNLRLRVLQYKHDHPISGPGPWIIFTAGIHGPVYVPM